MKEKSSKNSYKTAKSWRNAQNEVAIFVQNAILLFSEFSCMIKPENEGGKKLQAPRKVGPGECR
ncbi:MAG: hypothetical protein J5916_12615 [Oscillospiraceae bacterium]|nr:hypothetical protein [Oscillospiraceae bacterium]